MSNSRSSPRDKVGDEASGWRGLRQSKMAMAEGVHNVRRRRRWSDHRQAVGKRRPETDLLLVAVSLEA